MDPLEVLYNIADLWKFEKQKLQLMSVLLGSVAGDTNSLTMLK